MTSSGPRRLAEEILADCENHIRELVSLARRMRATEHYLEFLRSAVEEFEQFRGDLDWREEEFNRALQAQRRMAEVVEKYLGSLKKHAGVLERHVAQCFDHVRRLNARASLDRSPLRHEDVVALAQVGWYLDPNLPVNACRVLAAVLAKGGAEAVYERLTQHFRRRADEIESDVIGQFPHRSHILREAFEAHRQGRYNLSVPVLLAQADGMFEEALGALLFQARARASAHERLKANENIMLSPLIELIGKKIPLWKFGEKDDPALNRHTVLHGLDLRYGTEVNSLKVISFLAYLSFLLRHGKSGDEDAGVDAAVLTTS